MVRKWTVSRGSEDDGGIVYLHIMVREICTTLGTLALSGLSAQSDTLFPNVSGSWDMTTIHWDWDG